MFSLSKWYLDCVTDSGEAVVLYWASIRWGVLRLRYGACLLRNGKGDTIERYTFRPGMAPRVTESGDVRWVCRALEVDGSWVPRTDGFERTLLESEQGQIIWNCVNPLAGATIRVGKRTLRGMGYTEHLTMTVKPWQLPFQELRWGRFHSPKDVLVWIEWCGSLESSWVFLNGEEVGRARANARGVESSDGGVVLAIDDGAILRSGRLVDSALRPLRPLMWLMPSWRSARETKWIARGTMTVPAGICNGHVIHEVVRWE